MNVERTNEAGAGKNRNRNEVEDKKAEMNERIGQCNKRKYNMVCVRQVSVQTDGGRRKGRYRVIVFNLVCISRSCSLSACSGWHYSCTNCGCKKIIKISTTGDTFIFICWFIIKIKRGDREFMKSNKTLNLWTYKIKIIVMN